MSREQTETAEETTNTQRMAISGDQVQAALDRLVAEDEISDEGRKEIWWFYSFAMDAGYSLEDTAKAIGKDASTAHRLLTGRYGARYDGLVEAVRKFHRLADERGLRKKVRFVETSTFDKIAQVCHHALVGQLSAFIVGNSQIGKSYCLREYARRNNHGQTKLIELPAGATLGEVQRLLAMACWISPKTEKNQLVSRIMTAINDQMLVIVDEVHRPFTTSGEKAAVRIVEWLRQVYDNTGCGIVFCGTKVFDEELYSGGQARVLEQIRRRGIIELHLPDVPPKSDINRFAKEFGLPTPQGTEWEVIQTMLKRSGLKQYVTYLQSAYNLSQKEKKPISWDHFVKAWDLVQSLSAGK